MPLMDHFRPPLAGLRHWESFHALWLAELVATLNRRVLPQGYFAEAQVHVGGRVEVDVASFAQDVYTHGAESNGGVAVQTWSPPLTTLSMPLVFPDEIELQVFSTETGPTLVAAVELVSPGNKDRPETRIAFASKCASYLHQGIGVVVIDVVTDRLANLHNELIDLLRQDPTGHYPGSSALYAISYQPVRPAAGPERADVFFCELALGQPLPTVPLPLRRGPTLPLDLEPTYEEARGRSRL